MAGDPKPNAGGIVHPKPRWTNEQILEAIMHAMLDPDTDPALLPELREMARMPHLLAQDLNDQENLSAWARQRAAKAGKAK
jgi:hypothetical protein